MQFFDFIDKDELDNLPEDDREAFLEFLRLARPKLQAQLSKLDPDQEWELIQDAQHGFINVVTATARRLNVEPFSSRDVPKVTDLTHNDYRQFIADLDHYTTQMWMDGRVANRRESVELSELAKDSINTKLRLLREALERSNYDDRTKARLRARLDEFEQDLARRRINIIAVARVAFEILALPGALAGSYDVSVKLVNQIMQTIGEEKINEDERRRLPPVEKPAALMPPRVEEKKSGPVSGGFTRDLDSEIPF